MSIKQKRDYGEAFIVNDDVISCHFNNDKWFEAEYKDHKCIHSIWYDKDMNKEYEYTRDDTGKITEIFSKEKVDKG